MSWLAVPARKFWAAALVVGFLSAHSLLAQQQQSPTFSSQVKVVNVFATVRDKHGKIVSDLNKDDFTLEQDGHPQAITYFSKETDLPLTLGLLVDTSLSQRDVLDQERSASHGFLDHVLRSDKDKAFIIHFDHEVELLQDLTSSRDKLFSALGLLQTAQPSQDTSSSDPQDTSGYPGGGQGGGRRSMHRGGGTQLYDAIYLASNELMKKQQGRKALIVLSDGVDRGSKETLETAIESAERADTIVYSILFKGEQPFSSNRGFGFPGGMGGGMGRRGGGGRYPQEQRPDGKKVLDQISKETGGRMTEVSKKMTLDGIYASIEEDLRSQYNLGFTPSKDDAETGYHKLTVKTKQKDATIQARDGYYMPESQQ